MKKRRDLSVSVMPSPHNLAGRDLWFNASEGRLYGYVAPWDIYRGPTPPPYPKDGDLWFNTSENRLYEYDVS